jgi:AmmeMemoRadiSam system protein A
MNSRVWHESTPDAGTSGGTAGTELLRLARGSIEHGLAHREPLPLNCEELPRVLTEPAATFTTLHFEGKLRGCCGTLEAVRPLAEDVVYSAFRAAFRDVRFEPVGQHEVDAIGLEVAVLSPLESIPCSDEADLLSRLTPGADGLVIVADGRRATFLPKVWETLPDPRQFLAALKAKCGLAEDYWSERLEFQRYRTASYAESQNQNGDSDFKCQANLRGLPGT